MKRWKNILLTCPSLHSELQNNINERGNVNTNVTMRRICITIVAVKGNKYYIFLVRVCSHRYPASTAHMLYHHLGLTGTIMFFHIISQTARFLEKKLLNTKCAF